MLNNRPFTLAKSPLRKQSSPNPKVEAMRRRLASNAPEKPQTVPPVGLQK